jgi:hypothetical protein
MYALKTRLAALIGFGSAVILTGLAFAAPERVIEPEIADQGFPSFIQEQRQERIRIATKNGEQPRPAGSGIDECIAHCSNGVGW